MIRIVTVLVILVLTFAAVSCHRPAPPQQNSTGLAWKSDTAEFKQNAPARFQQLAPGMSESAVREMVGNPDAELDLWPPGQLGQPPVGKRYVYQLGDTPGVVWVDFSADAKVTGVFWRNRD